MMKNRRILDSILFVLLILSALANSVKIDYLPFGKNIFLYGLFLYTVIAVFINTNFLCKIIYKDKVKITEYISSLFLIVFSPYLTIKKLYQEKVSILIYSNLLYWAIFISSIINHFVNFKIQLYNITIAAGLWILLIFLPSHLALSFYSFESKVTYLKIVVKKLFLWTEIVYGFTIILSLILLIFKYYSSEIIYNEYIRGFESFFANTNILGLLMNISTTISLIAFVVFNNIFLKILFSIQSILSIFLLNLSHSRTGLMSLIIGITLSLLYFLYKLLYNKKMREYKLISVVLLSTLIFIIPIKFLTNRLDAHFHYHHKPSVLDNTIDEETSDEDLTSNTVELDENNDEASRRIFPYYDHKLSSEQIDLKNIYLRKLDSILSSRVTLVKETILMAISRPILGFGFHRLNLVAEHYIGSNSRFVIYSTSSSHNIFADSIMRAGLIGLFLIVLIIISIINISFKFLNRNLFTQDEKIRFDFLSILMIFTFLPTQLFELTAISSLLPNTILFWILVSLLALLSLVFRKNEVSKDNI